MKRLAPMWNHEADAGTSYIEPSFIFTASPDRAGVARVTELGTHRADGRVAVRWCLAAPGRRAVGVLTMPAILPFPVIPPDGPDAERDEELDRGAAILLLVEMVERWGVEMVHGWIRRIGDSQGKDVCR